MTAGAPAEWLVPAFIVRSSGDPLQLPCQLERGWGGALIIDLIKAGNSSGPQQMLQLCEKALVTLKDVAAHH